METQSEKSVKACTARRTAIITHIQLASIVLAHMNRYRKQVWRAVSANEETRKTIGDGYHLLFFITTCLLKKCFYEMKIEERDQF